MTIAQAAPAGGSARGTAGPRVAAVLLAAFATGCSGVQSALDPAGEEASQVYTLTIVMTVGAAIIWLGVMALMLYASRPERQLQGEANGSRLILWGGAVFPAVTLFFLLGFALWLMPGLRPMETPQAGADALRIEVTARQFWWRVAYRPGEAGEIVAANELRIPVGERVHLTLKADDVIHSFWVPSLAGKVDMIPGRTNLLSLLATKPGTYRGACTEFCGTSHALMAFNTIAMQPAEFGAWLAREAAVPATAAASGAEIFRRHGCSACHTIRGTDAASDLGPDLTHLGSRTSLAAGTLPNTVEAIARFVADPQAIKPDSHMPAFGMIEPAELQILAQYLKGLQ